MAYWDFDWEYKNHWAILHSLNFLLSNPWDPPSIWHSCYFWLGLGHGLSPQWPHMPCGLDSAVLESKLITTSPCMGSERVDWILSDHPWLRKPHWKQSGGLEIPNMVLSGCFQSNYESFTSAYKGHVSMITDIAAFWWCRAWMCILIDYQVLWII